MEDGAIIYADGTTVYPLLYAQEVRGKGENVTVVSGHGSVNNIEEYGEDVIDRLFEGHAIYVVSLGGYCPRFLSERYDFVAAGVLYRAVEKR